MATKETEEASDYGLKELQISENGYSIWAASDVDARLEAQQLMPERQVYIGPASGGLIRLKPGDTVVDVGANVGSFSRLAAEMVGSQGRVLALEPLPHVFQALRRNAAGHACWCKTHDLPAAPIGAVHVGIVPRAGQESTAMFTVFPRCTALSCLVSCRDDADAIQATQSIVRHDPAAAVSYLQAGGRLIARYLPWLYAPLHSLAFKSMFLRGAAAVACPAATLGQVMKDASIQNIDLLKINVERGEMGVLLSVPVQDWPRIQQVAMQLHDRQNALDNAYAFLGSDGPGGFSHIRHWKEPRFAGCCLVQVYAARHAPQ